MKLRPDLTGVPETMLWTLHNRASEAKKPKGLIRDPEAVRIYEALDYDYERFFGKAEGSHAVRAVEMDAVLRAWLVRHPDGYIVSLGEGLETQFSRIDNGRLQWLSVDLPDSMALREKFLPAGPRCRHFAGSALDRTWLDLVTAEHQRSGDDLFIVAQGLFMYLPVEETRQLLVDITSRLPGAEILFDTVPRWFSRLTLRGYKRTRYYQTPAMPWGIDCNEIAPTLSRWHISRETRTWTYSMPRGLPRLIGIAFKMHPTLRHQLPAITHAVLRPC
ncbi:MAG TPA: class I SAM-dependent methyltransferase [Dongiaceae bacterium]